MAGTSRPEPRDAGRGGGRPAALSAVRGAYGTALLLAPRRSLGVRAGARGRRGAQTFARLLGARQLLEAVALGPHPSARMLRTGAAVDALHAASMLPLALLRPGLRGPALASGATAAGLAVWGFRSAASRADVPTSAPRSGSPVRDDPRTAITL